MRRHGRILPDSGESMNFEIIRYIQGMVLKFEALFFLLPCLVAVIYSEKEGLVYLGMAAVCGLLGYLINREKPENRAYYAAEGLITVAISWIVLSVFGAIPFVITREIPSFTDALFETVSGFTTTGASILATVEDLSHASLFWRSFTHWVGGMGVIVFILAIMPMTGGYNMHLMRAESPGPSVGKLVPKMRDSAKILYLIYLSLTVAEIVLLAITGMPLFDAVTISFGSAGTGGFAVRNSGMAEYSWLMQSIIAVFILLFGVNFNFYFFLLGKHKKDAFKMTEVRWYGVIVGVSVILITSNIYRYHYFGSVTKCLHEALFQVASIITTTGFSSTDFNMWPNLSKTILVLLMFIGACAGSTGGGFKVSRVVILAKTVKREIGRFIHPRSVRAIKMDGKAADAEMVRGVGTYLGTYVFILVLSILLVGLFEETDLETNFTAVAATFNNIGPGLSLVGPAANYGFFNIPTKYVLIFDMLAGRLELYPMLMLFVPSAWRRK